MKIRILGSGTSTGVPEIGCTCAVCTSTDPRDCRLRTSALVYTDDATILLDCGPDFREQMLRVPFGKIDAVLISHEHYDHVGGLDDLRPFCRFGKCPSMPKLIQPNVCAAGCPIALWSIPIREFRIFLCVRLNPIALFLLIIPKCYP